MGDVLANATTPVTPPVGCAQRTQLIRASHRSATRSLTASELPFRRPACRPSKHEHPVVPLSKPSSGHCGKSMSVVSRASQIRSIAETVGPFFKGARKVGDLAVLRALLLSQKPSNNSGLTGNLFWIMRKVAGQASSESRSRRMRPAPNCRPAPRPATFTGFEDGADEGQPAAHGRVPDRVLDRRDPASGDSV
jgi:hypothetical protein